MVKLAVKRPILTTVVFVIILILGIISFRGLPIDFFPDIELPMVSIITVYPGASPLDIEKQVTEPLESQIATVPNIEKVQSNSSENISIITSTFEWGSDINVAASDIRDKISMIKKFLPEDVEEPMIMKFDASMMPVMVLSIKGNIPISDLYDISDKLIVNKLKEVPGVGAVELMGSKHNKVNIDLIPQKLIQYNLSTEQIKGLILANNLTMPAGNIEVGRKKYSLRVPGEYSSIDDIKNVVVGYTKMGNPILLRDIADITFGPGKEKMVNLINGKEGITLMIQKQSGANTVKVANGIKKELASVGKILPKGIEIGTIMDGSQFIEGSINNLIRTILWGFIFVVIVVFFFLWNIRGSLIIALTIPFSLIIAFIYLYFSKGTINIISLSSLSIALGMVVDNSIVVLENIFRHRDEEKHTRLESSIFGANEVASAIIASTLTTIAIFIPIFFIKGFTSVLFKQLAITISVVLIGSLFASLTLTPMLSSRILKKRKTLDKSDKDSLTIRIFRRIENSYSDFLNWALKHKTIVLSILVVIFILSLTLIKQVGTEFIPESDESMVQATIKMPIGTNLQYSKKAAEKIDSIIKKDFPEVITYRIKLGESEMNIGAIFGIGEGDNIITVMCRLKPKLERKRSTKQISDDFRKTIKRIPGIYSTDISSGGSEMTMLTGGSPISIEIYGYDLDATKEYALKLKYEFEKIKGLKDISISREENKPEFWINIDRGKAMGKGLSVYGISGIIRAATQGSKVSVYRIKGNEYDIFMKFKDNEINNEEELKKIPIQTPQGNILPLGAIATVEKREAPLSIERKDQIRFLSVDASYSGRNLGEIRDDINKVLKDNPKPLDVDFIKIAGSMESQQESFNDMLFAVLIGILLVYLVMSAQFESFVDPFVIMFSIPFALTGVIWALYITGNSFSLMCYIGLLMLVGIVVNNAIVLIDYTNLLRARGYDLISAIVNAGKRRLRPVLMTATTTIFGLLPLALSRGEGSESWSPLGITVIGGLLVSTLITLIIIPLIYSILESKIKRRKEL